jgi:hypothetical protein
MERWSFRPGLVSVAAVFVIELICKLPGAVGFLLIPLSLLLYALAAVGILVATVILAVKKRPRRAASILLALVGPVLLWWPINWATDCVHLGLTVGLGVGYYGARPARRSGFAVYDWSVGLAIGPSTFLIHDVTDQIGLPIAQHTLPSTSENEFREECAGNARYLLGYYYICYTP